MASVVWAGHITFGLVSFPVKLVCAARGESVSFNQLHGKDNARIKQVLYCQAEDAPISRTELVKGYEYEKDKYVVIEEADIKAVAPKTAHVMEIQEFVPATQVDPVYLESSYYVHPGDAGEKQYTLLFETLRQTQYYALAKVAMHNREHIVVLRPGATGLVLHTLYYQDEVRKNDEFRTVALTTTKELAMAKMLVEQMVENFEPQKYHDTYRDNLMAMIQARIQGQKVVATPTPAALPVIDIMEALKQSIETQKKKKAKGKGAGA